MTLEQLADKHGTDKGSKHYEAHRYADIYDEYIGEYRHESLNFMEIGVNDPRFPGASLRMWDEYFTHPDTMILGLDINPPIGFRDNPRVNLIKADQSKPSELINSYHYFDVLDFVIDDGLHTFDCQLNSFLMLFPKLKKSGWYFIEDCHAKDCHRTIELFTHLDKKAFGINLVIFHREGKLIAIQAA